ncbi:enoyl-(acyl carrier protein) reductase [Fragilaria crotonensis]|nr:enoyl-(acyl carrier protein) reductase [Fragilaria crotonensis]
MMMVSGFLLLSMAGLANAFSPMASEANKIYLTSARSTPTRKSSLNGQSRREMLDDMSSSASMLAALLLLQSSQPPFAVAASDDEQQPRKTILMTGSNSGIGLEAAKKLAQAGHTLILPCRNFDKAVATANAVGDATNNKSIIPAECDLADLSSIEKFGKELPSLLGTGNKLDVVCLNAGLARATGATDVARTRDGFELTVGTNHLGHFYLNSLLLPQLKSDGGRIVVTASSVHDPDSPGGAQGKTATLGDLTGFERDGRLFEMVDGEPFNADKAYKDSKLCNVLFFRELQRRLDASPSTQGIVVNAFTPGLIVSTGLFRDQPKLFTKVSETTVSCIGETPEWGGSALAYMTGVTTKGQYYFSPPGSSKYGDAAFGNQFAPASPSIEAQDDAKGKRLWDLSAKLVGL